MFQATFTLVPSDLSHPPFYLLTPDLYNFQTMKRSSISRYNFYKADYNGINEDLSNINWNNLLSSLSAVNAVSKLYDVLYDTIKKHTPLVTAKDRNFPIWFNPSLIRLFKNKKKAWTKWKKFKNARDYENFSTLRKQFKSECNTCFTKYIKSVEDSIKINPNYFWKFMHSRKSKSGLPSNMYYNNVACSDPLNICNTFSRFFKTSMNRVRLI